MDHRSLQMFLALAHHLHFAKASAALHVSPPTLSRNIQQLEQEVGAELFERTKRSVKLTRHGIAFLEYAQTTLAQWQKFKADIEQTSHQLSGSLSVYSSVTATYSYLHHLLKLVRQHFPKVDITLKTGDPALAIERVIAQHDDLAIAARPEFMPNGLAFLSLGFSPLVFIAPKIECEINSLIKEAQSLSHDIPWQKLPFIVPEQGLSKTRLARWWQELDITPQVYSQVAGNEAAVSMVSLGFGVALIPQVVLDMSPFKSQVDVITSSRPVSPFEIGLVVKQANLQHRVIGAVWQLLQENSEH